MTTLFSAIRVSSISKTITRNLLAALTLGMLFTACKKDKEDVASPTGPITGTPAPKEEGYYPSKANTVWTYRNEDDGDVTEHRLSVVSTKDSAGGKVIHYQSLFSDGTRINPFVHATNSQVTYANTLPSEMAELVDGLRQDPDISNLSLTGIPMLQKLPANPKVGDAIGFSEPLKLSWTQREDDEFYDIAFSFDFNGGKVLGFEDVTTPAGTFKNCMKWSYKAALSTKVGSRPANVVELQHTLWYAKGIGMVKTVETGGTTNNTSVLTSIQ